MYDCFTYTYDFSPHNQKSLKPYLQIRKQLSGQVAINCLWEPIVFNLSYISEALISDKQYS